jgi:N,N'-diacetyllegionaminate synthase
MVDGIRRVSAMLGDGVKAPSPQERDTALVARRSVVAAVDIPVGATITEAMLACRRPASGIAPRELPLLVGRIAREAVSAGTILHWDQLETKAGR